MWVNAYKHLLCAAAAATSLATSSDSNLDVRSEELSRERISHYPNKDLAQQRLCDFPFNKNRWCELQRGREDEILLRDISSEQQEGAFISDD